jgi:hypothetical protein
MIGQPNKAMILSTRMGIGGWPASPAVLIHSRVAGYRQRSADSSQSEGATPGAVNG